MPALVQVLGMERWVVLTCAYKVCILVQEMDDKEVSWYANKVTAGFDKWLEGTLRVMC